MRQLLLIFCFFATSQTMLQGQMVVGTDTLFGNEWIDYAKTYYKIGVVADGVYRIPVASLLAAGIPATSIPSQEFRLYHNGQQTPLYISSGNAMLGSTDFIEFYGQKNRDEVDRHLFDNPAGQNLNPQFSMFTDTAAYFLTWESAGVGLRYVATENVLTDLPAKEDYCWFNEDLVLKTNHFKRKESEYVANSWFDGEGFADAQAVNNTYSITPKKIFAAGPNAAIEIRYAGGLGQHRQALRINDAVVARDTFVHWKIIQRNIPVALNAFTPSLKLELRGEANSNDKHAVSYIRTRYPREFDFSNAGDAYFELDGGATGNAYRYLQIDGINGASDAVLLDLSTRSRYVPILEGGQLKFKVRDDGTNPKMKFVVAGAGIRTVQNLQSVTFRDFSQLDADYVILTHRALMQGGSAGGSSAIAEYAAYRGSAPGGGFRVATVDVTELYDQFGYGLVFHPMSIRNFVQYIHRNWSDPKYLFFVGKGLNYSNFRDPAIQASLATTAFFVPVYGSPGTDWPFVMRKGGLSAPLLAVGRLAVTKPFEIKDYLNKIIERDEVLANPEQTLANKAWAKTSIHTSGGSSAPERQLIANYVDDLSNVLRKGRIGAEVFTLYKNSNDPVQTSGFNKLQEIVNKGVSMWTIFGHSSPNIVDYDIGNATGYQNNPRYPVMMVLGCYSGLASQVSKGLGEEFILAPHSGAIGYIATSDYGLADGLHSFCKSYYQLLSGSHYGSSVGFALKGVIDSLYNTNLLSLRSLMHQMVLQGDPAVVIPGQPGPDYLVDNQSVRIAPNPVAINGAQYSLDFDLLNIGENTKDSIQLRIEQQLPNDSIWLLKLDTVLAPAFRSKYAYKFTADSEKMSGYNRILITADADYKIAELPVAAEANNELVDASGSKGTEGYFYTDEVKPIYPPPFAIVPRNRVTLSASAPFTQQTLQRFKFELDTLESFSSSFFQKTEVNLHGGIVDWSPEFDLENGKVYYWRVAKDTLIANQIVWQGSSFICLEGSSLGWNQSHYGQFIQNSFDLLDSIPEERRIDFVDNQTYALVRVAFRDRAHFPGLYNGFSEGFQSDYEWEVQAGQNKNGIALMVHHPSTGHVIMNPANGPFNPKPGTARTFFFFETQDSIQRLALMDFLENQVPDKSVVGLYAMNNFYNAIGYGPQFWANDSISYGKNLFQVFEALGAERVRSLANFVQAPHPYGFIFRKGDPQFDAIETIVTQADSVSEIRRQFPAKWFTGSTETSLVGPSTRWQSVEWARADFDNTGETGKMRVYGVPANGPDTLLYQWTQPALTEISSLDAARFPRLKITYQTTDSMQHTSAELRKLRVLFEGYPEAAIDPAAYAAFHNDTLEQGDPMRAGLAFTNVSDTPMDSLLVRFRVENSSGKQDVLRKFRPLPPGDTLHASVVFPTTSLQGEQRLIIDINPDRAQPELLHSNNVFVQSFQVRRDNRNPLLDVSFDGLHIMDGDLVSAKPEIVITLKDDNRFIPVTDSSAISLQILYPDGQTRPLLVSDPSLTYFPASGDLPRKNQARLEWRPTFTQDGDYKLVVNGRDAAGNPSAELDYTVNFKVITKSSISNLLNYPNPFSTSTCFVYTMTGAESPSNFKVQIMTVSGRVVREITTAEFGSLQVGTHLSDYCWDGKDQFGDQLANGVYLYRVVAKKADGSDFEAFENQKADSYFKQGFGKMVLMR